MQEFYISTNNGRVHCCRWNPKKEPIGIVQIIHGIREYTARYDHFAEYLSEQGFLVVGADLPGHGLTYADSCQRGYLLGGWIGAIKVIRTLHLQIKHEYPIVPYIFFGHSMGSYLLQTYLCGYSNELSAAVLSGTGWQNELLLSAGQQLCIIEASRRGADSHSNLIEELMFGAYNRKFRPNKTKYDWICSDPDVVCAYANDPLCTWRASIQIAKEMLTAIRKNQSHYNLNRIRKDLPVFFVSGQLDPVGNFGNGTLRTVSEFKQIGMKDILVELYPNMRHECINEIGKEKVYKDISVWLLSKIENL